MKSIDTYKFEYASDSKTKLRVYLIVAFLDLVLFGFLGLHYTITSIKDKTQEVKELQGNLQVLEDTKFALVDAQGDLKRAEPYLQKMDLAIPEELGFANYLVELSNAASAAGFSLSSAEPSITPGETAVPLNLGFAGIPSEMDELISVIENIERTTVVDSFTMDFKEYSPRNTVTARIFYVPKAPLDLLNSFNATIDVEFLKKEFEQPAL